MSATHRSPRLAVLAAACLGMALPAIAAAPTTLKDAFRHDFLVGAAITDAIASGRDARSQALVIQQFNTITTENELKPENVHPRRGQFDFSRGEAITRFGREHGMFVVGHTFLWHVQTPGWMFTDAKGKPNGADAQLEVLRDHIEHVAGHFASQVDAWDVANEVIDEDGSYRQSPWLKNIGDGDRMVREAFRYAARYAPRAELYYNDFSTETPAKRDGIVRMVKMLQANGLRIDGVGMQGHWGIDSPSIAEIETSIDTFSALGVKVMITELDIDVLPKMPNTDGIPADQRMELPKDPGERAKLNPWPEKLSPEMEQKLARRYADLFALFQRKRDKVARVTFWNVHNGDSWKNDYPVRGRTNYPLLFDRDRQPTPAFDAVIRVATQR